MGQLDHSSTRVNDDDYKTVTVVQIRHDGSWDQVVRVQMGGEYSADLMYAVEVSPMDLLMGRM